MNKLLPSIDECKPIIGDWKTFSDCSYNNDYCKLSFKQQLQIVADLVRQTILISSKPNPKTEMDELEGDSYTASLVAQEYLKESNIGKNIRLAIQNDIYEDQYQPNYRIVLLVDDMDNNTYVVDCTPDIGYGCGKVVNIVESFYEYHIITEEIKKILFDVRLKINSNDKKDLLDLSYELKKYPFLIGYYNELNNLDLNNKINQDRFNNWKKELNELNNNSKYLKRRLELAQSLTSELINAKLIYDRDIIINNNKILLRNINSRYFYENACTLVLIKPSSYLLGINASVKDKLINGKLSTASQNVNLGLNSELFSLPLMDYFHPHGYKYARSMTGPSNLFLVYENPIKIGKIKKDIRNTYGNVIKNHNVQWFDEKPILWDPIVTNLVHSTDDACETAMHFLSPYPEFQIMTRYMYPNPILQKERKR